MNYRDDDGFQCLNCLATLGKDDKYCKICGTKKGEGSYCPTSESMLCIYGPPPVKRRYKCEKCGYKWEDYTMVPHHRYCPQCRTICECTTVGEENPWD